ncbi:MAG TPA: ATP-grasp domain-containing protein [Gemmatimonadales bacterium]
MDSLSTRDVPFGIASSTPFLIVAVTGRALAVSAARGGHRAVVLDCFADRDTRAVAAACRSVVSTRGLRFDPRALRRAVEALAPGSPLVYGSGFEGATGLLGRIAAGRPLYGNGPETVAAVRDPARFFPLLDRLGLAHPEVRLARPADGTAWVVKRAGGAGGAHVRRVGSERPTADSYYQRFERGRTLSVLFLADRARAHVLGVNQQWTAPARHGLSFLYGGAVGGIQLPPAVEREIRDGLDALVAATGLVGLNGLDFILRGTRWLVLELNPRPTATAELYDADYARGLFDRHLRACQGELPRRPAAARAVRAHAVVYAAAPAVAGGDFAFPSWCRDVPVVGTRVGPGDPVCTVHASGPDAERTLALLRRRHAALQSALTRAAA